MATNLTDTAINSATRRAAEIGARIALTDPGERGLQLRITATGTKTWCWYGRDAIGRPRRFPLGQHPAMGLSAARAAARTMREKVRNGADPVAETRRKRAIEADAKGGIGTLRAVLDLYGAKKADTQRAWGEARKRIDLIWKSLLDRPAASLTIGDLQLIADRYEAQWSAAYAVRSLRPALKWAAQPGRAYVPRELCDLVPPVTVRRRERVLDRDELQALLPVLDAAPRSYGPAMKLMLLTLARREEIAAATWGVVDLAAKTLTIPAGVAKNKREHVVPLSRQAIAVLCARLPVGADGKPVAPDPGALIFATGSGGKLGNWDRETKHLQKASGTEGWTRHDLRRTGATLLGQSGVEPHVIEAALNHAHIHSQIASVYNTSRYRPQVATALQQLADLLDGFEGGGAEILSFTR